MAKRITITGDDVALLDELRKGVGRPYLDAHRRLEKHGLITITKGRFGEYARITDEGSKHLARIASSGVVGLRRAQVPGPDKTGGSSNTPHPAATSGPPQGGVSIRAASARVRRNGAKQAGPA